MKVVAAPSTQRVVLYVSRHLAADIACTALDARWQIVHAKTAAEAERALAHGSLAVVLLDLTDTSLLQQLNALGALAERAIATWVALVSPGQTGDAPIRRFILDFCFDFVIAPCPNERLMFVLGHAYGLSALRIGNVAPPSRLSKHKMIGQCDAMQKLYRGIDKCAATDAPVFIAGESGTGKELTARAIHDGSSRRSRPYVAINCASIPPTLLQSELFGYERGAFTGASQRRIGRIEAAHGGTLFLDEIGDMPSECQAVLLRFLQEGTIERLGGIESIRVDVRVISATHIDLDAAVAAERFRADLYHRLCVLRLVEPPLRERGDDIRLLAIHALNAFRHDCPRKLRGLSADALDAMYNYPWPGNVRELINCVHRAIVMADGRFITTADLGLPLASNTPPRTLAEIRSEAERRGIEQALQRHAYRLTDAAEELGVSRTTLYRMIHAAGLGGDAPPDFTAVG